MENIIKQKILNKQAVVGVVGLGYVGLPLAMLISNKGFKTYGFDIDENKIELLKKKKSYISHIPEEKIKEAKNLIPTSDFSLLKKCDVIIICVPTPTTETNEPDLSAVINTAETIAKYLRKGQLVVLESTTYPTTTRNVLKPILEKTGLKCGVDFYLAFSPEREDPGRKDYTTETIPKVVGGVDKISGEVATLFYSQVVKKVVPVSSSEVAEATKMLENTFRAVNIALVNELKMLFDKMGIDIWEVIEASKTKPFGFMPFYPGPGWGGHCFDKDQFVLIKTNQGLNLFTFEKLYEYIKSKSIVNIPALCRTYKNKITSFSSGFLEVLKPVEEIQILGVNLNNNATCLQSINFISKRYAQDIMEVELFYGYKLNLTSKHPVFVFDEDKNRVYTKFVENLTNKDFLILPKNLPEVYKELRFDLIDILKRYYPDLIDNYRVSLIKKTWKDYKKVIYENVRDIRKYDWLKNNYIPLREYLRIEEKLNIKRENLLLFSGNGSAVNRIRAILNIEKNFARLIGYYLSEGCITQDKKSIRIRFTFNVKEKEYINDLKSILNYLGIKFSVYRDKKFDSLTIKISNRLLGLFFRDVLKTGVDSYEMKIPDFVYFSNEKIRKEVLKGIFRGDAGIYLKRGKRSYFKNNKKFEHNDNSLEICYFTSSKILFSQIVSILHENGILPIINRKRNNLIKIFSKRNIIKLRDVFLGRKKKLINIYLSRIRKQPNYKNYFEDENFFYLKIKNIKPVKTFQEVYSVEVEPFNNLLVNYNILVHNCIPVDPFYLSYIAKKHDFTTHFIELAGQINIRMPEFVVEKVVDELNKRKKTIFGAKILVLGLSYKKDIGDPRESPSFKIIELLEKKGAKVDYNDPYIPETPKMRKFRFCKKSVPIDKNVIKKYDCVIIATDHSCYDYKMIVENAKLIVDTRNAVFNALKKNFKNVVKA